MNIEIINSLKQRAKEMLENNYNRKIGYEEVYTIICELENFYTAYGKEKEKNKEIEELKDKNKTLKNLQNDTNGLYIGMIERKNYFERELQKLEETKNKLVRYIAIKEGKDYEQVCREFEI